MPMRWRWIVAGLALLALAVGMVAGFLSGHPRISPAAPVAPTTFDVTMAETASGEVFFRFRLSTLPVPDLEPRPDGSKGSGKWVFGDRIAYDTAYWFFAHEDPGAHPFLNGIRIMVQQYNAGPPPGKVFLINDRNGVEINLRRPYPYEKATIPLDYSRPGATVHLYHHRPNFESASGCRNCQLLATFVIPPVDPANPKVKWYYQLGGLVVAVHDTYGPIARIIISGVLGLDPFLPMYFYEVEGSP